MIKGTGGQIRIGWISIVLSYSPLLLNNQIEKEIKILLLPVKSSGRVEKGAEHQGKEA